MDEADPFYSSFIANCVFNAFSSYTAIVLNIVTIHAIRKTSSLPNPSKTLLLSLAVSDLGVGLLAQPLFNAWMVNPTPYFTHIAFNITMVIFSVASFLSVVAISVDRFLAIHLRLRYQEHVTHKRVVAAMNFIWILSTFLGLTIFWMADDVFIVVINIIFGRTIQAVTETRRVVANKHKTALIFTTHELL
ncbi:hypothetical protein ACROYT_G039059 [Oculina patagonica]